MEKHDNLNLSVLDKNPGKWQNRLIIGTPMTGLVRAEWMFARYGQIIPTNWSVVDVVQFMSSNIPLEYQVADAYNIIIKTAVEKSFEWVLFIEQDNILPADGFVKMNQYMIDAKIPVVGGLYFTKSDPPEPLVYRGAGTGHYDKWKMGDKVWVDGLPFGFTLIHGSIIREMWNDSPEYLAGNTMTRRVFQTPNTVAVDPSGAHLTNAGTQDLDWCKRVIEGNYFEKAGWPQYQKMQYPFLVDTSMFVKHITLDGVQYPLSVPDKFIPEKKELKKESVRLSII